MTRKRVLFLCTGNSCRSQMAEAMVNHYLGDEWEAVSAGTKPAGYVHPLALKVLGELDVLTAGLRSKTTEEFRDSPLDLAITVCDDAAENCPVWLGTGQRLHISFPDPAEVKGSEAEKLAAFRQVRDDIKDIVIAKLQDDVS